MSAGALGVAARSAGAVSRDRDRLVLRLGRWLRVPLEEAGRAPTASSFRDHWIPRALVDDLRRRGHGGTTVLARPSSARGG